MFLGFVSYCSAQLYLPHFPLTPYPPFLYHFVFFLYFISNGLCFVPGRKPIPSPHPEGETEGENQFLAILSREGIANEAEGLSPFLSNLDNPAPSVEAGGPEPCPRVTTPLPLVPLAPDELSLDPAEIPAAQISYAGPTLPPQVEALGKRSTGGF